MEKGTGASERTLRLRSGAAEWREVDGEVIALDRDAAEYLSGNVTATIIWRALAEGTTRAGLISSLSERFEIDEIRAAADVDAFLQELRARDLMDA